jgi:hypothetical protein
MDNNKNAMNTKITLFVMCILLIIGCSNKEKRVPKDKFYAFTGGWGEMNIPLIKPLNLFCYDGKDWMLDGDLGAGYKRDGGGCSIGGVQRFYASDSLFLFRSYGSSGVIIKGELQPEGWFIVSIQNKTMNGYTDYEAFRDTVFSKFQITVDTLSWRIPKSSYKEFKKEGIMPWFPDSIW